MQQDWANWALVFCALIGGAASIMSLLMRGQFASKMVVDAHVTHLGKIDVRLAAIEKAQEDQPDIHELARRIEGLSGDLRMTGAKIEGLSDALDTATKHIDLLLGHELKVSR